MDVTLYRMWTSAKRRAAMQKRKKKKRRKKNNSTTQPCWLRHVSWREGELMRRRGVVWRRRRLDVRK